MTGVVWAVVASASPCVPLELIELLEARAGLSAAATGAPAGRLPLCRPHSSSPAAAARGEAQRRSPRQRAKRRQLNVSQPQSEPPTAPAPLPAAPRAAPGLVLAVTLDGLSLGDALVLVEGARVALEVRALLEHGFDPAVVGSTQRQRAGVAYVVIEPPCTSALDEAQGALTLTVPAERLALQRRELRGASTPAESRTTPSLFLTAGGQLLGTAGVLSAELGLRADDLFLDSTASWSSTTGLAVRGLSTATVELPAAALRLSAGDVVASGAGFSGGLVAGGVQLARNFAMDPSRAVLPDVGGLRGLAQTPSTLEVYVNERLVSRSLVAPGPWEVSRLPLTEGLGTTRYVLRDAFGQEQRLDRPYALARGALAPGLHAFSWTLGFERRDLATQSFAYGAPALLGVHRLGVTSWLTAECSLQARPGLVAIAPRVDLALPVGLFGVVASGSAGAAGAGFAGGVDYSVLTPRGNVSASVRGLSAGYETVGVPATSQRLALSADLRGNVSPLRGWNLGAQARSVLWRDGRLDAQATVTSTVWLTSRVSLAASGTVARAPVGVALSGLATVNVLLGETVTASAGLVVSDAGPVGTLDVQRTPGAPTGFDARGQLTVGPSLRGTVSAGYAGDHGRLSAGLDADGEGVRPVAQGAASLLLAGGHVFLSRAVDSSFAVVEAPHVADARVMLEHREVGRTDAAGTLLVQGLAPWQANELELVLDDVPADVVLRQDAPLRVVPRPLSGLVARFDTTRLQVIRGRVELRRGGRSFIPAGGALRLRDGTRTPLGTGGEYELEVSRAGRLPVQVDFDGARCEGALDVPALEGTLHELGVFTCDE